MLTNPRHDSQEMQHAIQCIGINASTIYEKKSKSDLHFFIEHWRAIYHAFPACCNSSETEAKFYAQIHWNKATEALEELVKESKDRRTGRERRSGGEWK